MSKLILTITCGLFLYAAGPPTSADYSAEQPERRVRILADILEVSYGDMSIATDVATGSMSTGHLSAFGNVTFRQGDRVLKGESFTYDLAAKRGLASNASAEVDNILFRGAQLKAEPEGLIISNSTFTTCNAPQPHFYLAARELSIDPGDNLVGRDVSIVAFGKRILNVPKYRINLKKRDRRAVTLPPVGMSGAYGLYTGYRFDLSREPGMLGELDLRLSTRQALQGGLKFSRVLGKPILANLTYREAYYGGRRSDLLVSRLPEIAMRFHTAGSPEPIGSADESLHLSRSLLDPTAEQISDGRINVVGEIGAGYFTEEPYHIKSQRLDVRAIAWLDPIWIDRKTMVSPGALVRTSQYGSGDTYTSLGVRLAVARALGNNCYIAASYVSHAIAGHTPFEFDKVEVPHELAAKVRFPLGSFTFELGGRYDVQRSSLFDSEISVAKVVHCMEPRITWKNRFRELAVDVELLGF